MQNRGFRFEFAIYPFRVFRFNRKKSTLQRHNTENSKHIFPGKELRAPVPIFRKFAVIFAKKCSPAVSTTPAIKDKNIDVHIFHILLRACLSAHYTLRLNFCLFLIFRSIGKLVLSALTPAKNLSAVSMTLMNSFSAIVDTGENFRLFGDSYRYQRQGGKILFHRR